MICIHRSEAEMVIWMEEDNVGLDPHPFEFGNSPLYRLKKCGIETIQIECVWTCLNVRIDRRFFAVEDVPLGKQSEADLSKRTLAQRFQGLTLESLISVSQL